MPLSTRLRTVAALTSTEPPVLQPDELGGASLTAWFKADTITGLSEGDPVITWTDQSANGIILDQAISTPPVYRADGPLGLPCLDHTVPGGLLGSGWTNPTGDYTYFMVVQANAGGLQSIMGASYGGLQTSRIGFDDFHIALIKSGAFVIETSVATLTPGTWTIVLATFVADGKVVHFDIGGTVEDYSLGGSVTFDTDTNLAYGSDIAGAHLFSGKLAEIGLYSSVLPFGELASLKDYLTAKYGISAEPPAEGYVFDPSALPDGASIDGWYSLDGGPPPSVVGGALTNADMFQQMMREQGSSDGVIVATVASSYSESSIGFLLRFVDWDNCVILNFFPGPGDGGNAHVKNAGTGPWTNFVITGDPWAGDDLTVTLTLSGTSLIVHGAYIGGAIDGVVDVGIIPVGTLYGVSFNDALSLLKYWSFTD